jgi:hypothetical protein
VVDARAGGRELLPSPSTQMSGVKCHVSSASGAWQRAPGPQLQTWLPKGLPRDLSFRTSADRR